MSDNKQAKAAVVSQIEEKLGKAKCAVLIDYIGLTVAEVTDLRNQFRAAGVEYKVLKNTMINRAAGRLGIRGLEELSGPTAVAFSYGDPTLGARIILDYQKKTKKTQIKSAVLGRRVIGAEDVTELSRIPSMDVLIAQLLGVMNGPARGLVTVLNGPARGLVTALKSIQDKKESA